MSKEYRNVIIAVAVIAVVIAVGIFIYWQKTNLNPFEREIINYVENTNLSGEQKVKVNEALEKLRENPEDVEALISIAIVKYDINDLDGALEIYSRVLEIQPTNVVALNNSAAIYRQKKDYKKAAAAYLLITQQTPKWINAYRELMSLYKYHFSEEKYLELEPILLNGLEKSKDMEEEAPVDFYSMLAVFYEKTGQIDKAIEYYEKVVESTPQNTSAQDKLEQLKNL